MLVLLSITILLGVAHSMHFGKKEDANGVLSQETVEMILDEVEERLENKERERQSELDVCNSTSTRCQGFGGFCYTRFTPKGCDYTLPYMCRDEGCMCCIDCDGTQYKSECRVRGGTCRKCGTCYDQEYPTTLPCPYSGCTCCRKCDTPEECKNGVCVRDVTAYVAKGYVVNPSIKCKQRECTCVQRRSCPITDEWCQKVRGKCMNDVKDCPEKYLKEKEACGDTCFCCYPPFRTEAPITKVPGKEKVRN